MPMDDEEQISLGKRVSAALHKRGGTAFPFSYQLNGSLETFSGMRGPHFRMACGMRQLSSGHAWTDDTKVASLHVNCPTCLPQCQRLGTPFSELSGRPGEPGYSEFVRIGKSWGYP